MLRASRSGVVTAVRFEVGQVVAEGQPVVAIADPRHAGDRRRRAGRPVDGVQDRRTSRPRSRARRTRHFEVALRELSPQAAAQTRTYRARLKPVSARPLPLGATATLVTDRVVSDVQVAAIPATALTQANGHPAVWLVKRAGDEPVGSVDLMPVAVHGYRNDLALVSGVPAGGQVVTAGVQKMAPGLEGRAARCGAR